MGRNLEEIIKGVAENGSHDELAAVLGNEDFRGDDFRAQVKGFCKDHGLKVESIREQKELGEVHILRFSAK